MGTFIKSDFRTTDSQAPQLTRLIARDTFSKPNGAPGVTEVGGYTWKTPPNVPNNYKIQDGVLLSGVSAQTPYDLWIDPGVADGVITMTPLSPGVGVMASILFRRIAVGHTAWVYYARPASHVLAVRTGTDSFTVVEPTGNGLLPFTAGEQMRVEMKGSRIICSVNGVVTHDVTDTRYLGQTGIGVHTRTSTDADPAKFDNFVFSA